MATEKSSASAQPSAEDHDDTVETHYSGLERLRPHACYEGFVYIGLLVEVDGEDIEVFDAVPCRRCAGDVH